MNKKSTRAVIDRIKHVFDIDHSRAGSDARICEVLGLNRQTLSSWLGRDSVPYSLCVQVAEEKNISLDWLLTGAGTMQRNTVVPASAHVAGVSLSPRQQALLDLFNALPEEKQREAFSALEDKKRLANVEHGLRELQAVVAELKRSG